MCPTEGHFLYTNFDFCFFFQEDNKQCRLYADAKRKLMKLRSIREKEIAE